jgi:predicted Ser/Thr protein kinase
MVRPTDRGPGEAATATLTGAVAAAERLAAGEDPDATSVTAIEPAARHRAEPPTLVPATRVDRFLILEKLGEGGMGAVYAAYDTLLDRKVAMKVVRPDRRSAVGGVPPRERLLREAQAMARLRHPNVVAVLEVGELGDDVYLTLELIEGETLKTWLRAARRPWPAVVATFLAAGRGLAAAHAAGLVHRDFKPDNVLLGKDGRIQVADFGVASMSHGPREQTPSGDALDVEGGDAFTLSGLRVGTPAYMAPEQHAGGTVDARADQFSFCVALWEGVFGERPFASGGTVPPAERPLRPPPATVDAPGWLVALLKRGLAPAPDARWPSMDALLVELGRDRGSARRRIAWGLGLGAALVGVGALAVIGWTRGHAAPPRPCQDEARRLIGVWDDARAAALTEALAATGAPGAAAAAARVRGFVDRWSGEWVAQRTEACAATRVHGDQSEAMLDARMRCLDRRLERVNQLVSELGTLPRDQVSRAVEIASDLPGLDDCADAEQLGAAVPLPRDPAVRAGVESVDDGLAHVLAVEQTGHYPDALALARPLVGRAQALAYPPLHAEALAVLGRLHAQVGEHAAAVAALEEASAMAAGAHADDVAADALVELIWATAEAGQGARALAMAAGATAAVARTHDPRLEATLVSQLGTAALTAGDAAGANRAARARAGADRARVGADPRPRRAGAQPARQRRGWPRPPRRGAAVLRARAGDRRGPARPRAPVGRRDPRQPVLPRLADRPARRRRGVPGASDRGARGGARRGARAGGVGAQRRRADRDGARAARRGPPAVRARAGDLAGALGAAPPRRGVAAGQPRRAGAVRRRRGRRRGALPRGAGDRRRRQRPRSPRQPAGAGVPGDGAGRGPPARGGAAARPRGAARRRRRHRRDRGGDHRGAGAGGAGRGRSARRGAAGRGGGGGVRRPGRQRRDRARRGGRVDAPARDRVAVAAAPNRG